MTILRWVIAAALAMAFLLLAVANWTPVPFRLPDGAIILVRLPLLLAAAFVAGWLPTWLYHLAVRSRLKRRLVRTETSQLPPMTPVTPVTPVTPDTPNMGW